MKEQFILMLDEKLQNMESDWKDKFANYAIERAKKEATNGGFYLNETMFNIWVDEFIALPPKEEKPVEEINEEEIIDDNAEDVNEAFEELGKEINEATPHVIIEDEEEVIDEPIEEEVDNKPKQTEFNFGW